jgi:aerobic C4-dicarboxylate transport protein
VRKRHATSSQTSSRTSEGSFTVSFVGKDDLSWLLYTCSAIATTQARTTSADKAQGRRSPPRFLGTLYGQVLLATILGVAVGHFFPGAGAALKPLGDGFIKLVRMIVTPLIFATVTAGVAGVGDTKAVGKTGGLAILYFEAMTTLALVIGLVVVNLVQPGVGMNVDATTLDTAAVAEYVSASHAQNGAMAFVLGLIPTSVVDALARGDILQVLVFSVLFGFALHAIGAAGRPIAEFIDRLSDVLFGIVGLIMKTAPIGAFGAMAFTIGTFGVGTLAQYGKLMACVYVTCLLFVFVVLNLVARLHGFDVWRLIVYIKDELFVAFGTSSSEAVLPRIIGKLEALGVDRSVVGLVIPAGYSFNLDGSAIYLSIAAVFIAQATNSRLDLAHQIALLAILMLTSKGTAGVAGAALVVLAGTISAAGTIPVGGMVLVLGIHRFMGEAMAVTNLVGNGVATIVVGKWCGQLDEKQLQRELQASSENATSG